MESLAPDQINTFLNALGERYPHPATLLLLGGSALCLLGNARPTLDIDFVGDDLHKDALQQVMEQVAQELHVLVEAVPIDQFIPIPAGADERRLFIGRFTHIDVYVLDPYTISLSKLDRGFDTDLEDIMFLIRRGFVTIEQLEQVVATAATRSHEFGMSGTALYAHMRTVLRLLG